MGNPTNPLTIIHTELADRESLASDEALLMRDLSVPRKGEKVVGTLQSEEAKAYWTLGWRYHKRAMQDDKDGAEADAWNHYALAELCRDICWYMVKAEIGATTMGENIGLRRDWKVVLTADEEEAQVVESHFIRLPPEFNSILSKIIGRAVPSPPSPPTSEHGKN